MREREARVDDDAARGTAPASVEGAKHGHSTVSSHSTVTVIPRSHSQHVHSTAAVPASVEGAQVGSRRAVKAREPELLEDQLVEPATPGAREGAATG